MVLAHAAVHTLADAQALDAADPLAAFRQQFWIPPSPQGGPSIYFCGNSLGLQPRAARARIEDTMRAWEQQGISGYFEAGGWGGYTEQVKAPLAQLVGAHPDEVAAANTTTVNINLLLSSFYRPEGSRRKIAVEARAFPSDRYAAASILRARGADPRTDLIELEPRPGEDLLRTEDVVATLQSRDDIALLLLAAVNYYTGQAFDLAPIIAAAHAQGICVGVDLAHAIGNVPMQLHAWGADFAVWCSYKYLNAGPGAVGGLYVHRRHHSDDRGRLEGWWGNAPASRFLMRPWFEPGLGAEAWVQSSPPAPMLALLIAGLEGHSAAGSEALRQKSLALTGLLEQRIDSLPPGRVQIITPRAPQQRGAQLSLRVGAERKDLYQSLMAAGVVCDWREPDVIRVAPVPLYNTFAEVWQFVELLRKLL